MRSSPEFDLIAAMIEVIEAEHPPYRTVRPAVAEEMVRREQAEEWTITV